MEEREREKVVHLNGKLSTIVSFKLSHFLFFVSVSTNFLLLSFCVPSMQKLVNDEHNAQQRIISGSDENKKKKKLNDKQKKKTR